MISIARIFGAPDSVPAGSVARSTSMASRPSRRRPEPLLADVWARVSDPLSHPRTLGMTVALTALLSVLYLVLYAFAQLPAAERASR